MTDQEHIYWKQLKKSYMTEEIESEELENIKCHHFPRTSQCILFSVNAIHIIMYHKLQC